MSAIDQFQGHIGSREAPATAAFEITPDDDADIEYVTRGVYLGSGGDLHCTMLNGAEVTFTALAPGVIHPIRIKRVFEDSTASDIVGVY